MTSIIKLTRVSLS